jgi:NADH-quinone oxidoreductase subunit L
MNGLVLAALTAQVAPLAACAVILTALRTRPRAAAATAVGALTLSVLATAVLVWRIAIPNVSWVAQAVWLPVQGSPGLAFGVMADPLAATMAFIVAFITLAVMVYSLGYMHGDPGFARYFGFLALFGWAMLGLVLASNLLQLLVFWELVGLASFLLIGFWFERPAPAAAARKAFLMTRVGDVGFLLGVLLLIRQLGIATIPDLVRAATTTLEPGFVQVVAVLLLMGVIGKSAQGPLFTWLPDAMEGPTPVSALLHSATMVAAGVFLVARLHGFFAAAPAVMQVLLWLALVTALATATMAMVAGDIKRVLAYSSISQLGYMLMALAAGSVSAGFFHLTTHAGFKALLFLASGIFIHHAHSNEMKEIARHHPTSQKAGVIGLVAGSAALAGVIPFAGYFSKEAILASLGEHAGSVVLALAYLGAGLTAYYSFRMVFLTLRGGAAQRGRADERTSGHVGAHGAAVVEHVYVFGARAMAGVVLVLSALTLVLGYLGGFFATRLSPGSPHEGPFHVGGGALVALGLVAAGIALAWVEFGARGASRVGFAERNPAVRDFLGDNWYVDRLYRATVVRWALALSRAAKWNDHTVLDGASDIVADGTVWGGRILSMVQNGYVQAYLAAAISVVAALGIWLVRTGGQP